MSENEYTAETAMQDGLGYVSPFFELDEVSALVWGGRLNISQGSGYDTMILHGFQTIPFNEAEEVQRLIEELSDIF